MAEGFSAATATAILDALCNGTPFSVAGLFMKLHTGAPGAAGTANAATETTRKAVSFGTVASGAVSNDVAASWTNVAGTEDYTHATFWDHVSAGSFQFSGTITANSVTAGDDFTVPIGDVDISLPVAS